MIPEVPLAAPQAPPTSSTEPRAELLARGAGGRSGCQVPESEGLTRPQATWPPPSGSTWLHLPWEMRTFRKKKKLTKKRSTALQSRRTSVGCSRLRLALLSSCSSRGLLALRAGAGPEGRSWSVQSGERGRGWAGGGSRGSGLCRLHPNTRGSPSSRALLFFVKLVN